MAVASGALSAWLKAQRPQAGGLLRAAVAAGTLGGILIILQAWLLALVVNAVLFENASLGEVLPWMLWMLPLFALRALATWASEQLAFEGAARVKTHLRRHLFRHIQNLGPVTLAGTSGGDLASSLADGVEALEGYYARFIPAMSLVALVPLAILVVVFPTDWLSGVVMLVTAPLIPIFMMLIGKGAEHLNQRQWRQLARMSAHFLDVIRGLTTLKLFNASRAEAELVARVSDDYRVSTMKVLRVAFLSSAVLEFFSTVSIAIVAVLIGFRLLEGEMPFLAGFFVLLLAPEYYLPLRNMGTHYHARMEAVGAAERMVEILALQPPGQAEETAQVPARPWRLAFDEVHVSYGERQALKGLDLSLAAGETLALVGPSGAGKSTLVNLLLGFIRPSAGHVRINETPLDAIRNEQWHQHLAWVPQNPHLFHGTLLDNIRLGVPDADMASVVRAAHQARADDFIRAQPQGYDTLVGEGGQGLSGGQIQRLALARAFLRDAPLVILDEPTASLDTESERLVQEGIHALARDRTLIIIAHRLATVKNADRIVVLDDGQVAESGRHDELLAQDGLYARLLTAGTALTPGAGS